MANDTSKHRWRFFRAGGFDQVRLDRGEDLLALADLDQKLWVALSCPVHGLEFDEKTLELIDTDKDGRIRAPEILAAVKWATSVLKNPESILKGSPALPLSAIDAEHEEGKRLLASAREILKNLDKTGAKEITLADTADTARIFAATQFNGDGIVPVASGDDEATQAVIQDIIACLGSDVDRSGAPGVSQARVDQFFTEAEAYSSWRATAEADHRILPLGEETLDAMEVFQAVKAKVDDYFARTRLVAFDARSAPAMNRDEAEYAAIAKNELHTNAPEIASFPLAKVEAHKPLPLRDGVNPAWADAIAKLADGVVKPILGDRDALTDAEWHGLSANLAAFEAWRVAKPAVAVEKLGLARLREILASGAKATIDALIVKDKALEPEANAIDSVDRLVRYHRDLSTLLNNFITFRDFYSRKKKALFQAGTLYLDGRSCDLCVKVADASAHATIATLAGTYLVYCECTRKATNEKIVIAAALTGGDADALMVGRNGIFYDRKGRDWDATIVKLLQHPISVREAYWLPYKRVGKLIGDQVEQFASAHDKQVHQQAAAQIGDTAKVLDAPPAPAPVAASTPAAGPSKFDVGALAAISIGIGAVGSAIAAVATGFIMLSWWQMPLALAGVMSAISGPSVLLAWLKLRQRNIGPLLDANGWAVNARAKINIPFGGSLTGVAALPLNSERSLDDPFAEPQPKWKRYVVLAVTIALLAAGWHFGLFQALWSAMSERAAARAARTAASASASAAPAAPPAK
jgi:hypothetical protein